mmetsp:Transcript_18383/g.46117  ORF Transcript_18383/g.46117 Transcript_18383/m.46117 type:complete len:200 (-) Transcript_18383:542-1141(-)
MVEDLQGEVVAPAAPMHLMKISSSCVITPAVKAASGRLCTNAVSTDTAPSCTSSSASFMRSTRCTLSRGVSLCLLRMGPVEGRRITTASTRRWRARECRSSWVGIPSLARWGRKELTLSTNSASAKAASDAVLLAAHFASLSYFLKNLFSMRRWSFDLKLEWQRLNDRLTTSTSWSGSSTLNEARPLITSASFTPSSDE